MTQEQRHRVKAIVESKKKEAVSFIKKRKQRDGTVKFRHFTKCPNILIDHLFPILQPVDFKVFMLILRHSVGFQRDWARLSSFYICQQTGLHPNTLTFARRRLLKLGLISYKTDLSIGNRDVIVYKIHFEAIEEAAAKQYPHILEEEAFYSQLYPDTPPEGLGDPLPAPEPTQAEPVEKSDVSTDTRDGQTDTKGVTERPSTGTRDVIEERKSLERNLERNVLALSRKDSEEEDMSSQEPGKSERTYTPGSPPPAARKEDLMDTAIRVLKYFNEESGKNFRINKENLKWILRTLSDGWTEEDCRLVVDYKVHYWRNNPGMREFLRPQTVFGRNFESYRQNILD